MQPRLLTATSLLTHQLRELASSLSSLSLATPERRPSHPDRSDEGLVPPSDEQELLIDDSNELGSSEVSARPEEHSLPESRLLAGFGESLDEMRALVGELQSLAFMVPASSVPEVPAAALPVASDLVEPATTTDLQASGVVTNGVVSNADVLAPQATPQASVTEPVATSPTASALLADPTITLSGASSPACVLPAVPGFEAVEPLDAGLADADAPARNGRLIESRGDVSLYKISRHRYMVDVADDAQSIEIDCNRRALKNYRVIGAEAHQDGIQLLMRDGNRWASGVFNEAGNMIDFQAIRRTQLSALEVGFDQDLDGNQSIASKSSRIASLIFGSASGERSLGSAALISADSPAETAAQLDTPSIRSSIS